MDVLHIKPDRETPLIVLDHLNERFEISGKSLPENTIDFYKPVLEWLDKYAMNPNGITRFKFNLEYYNSASSKVILNILYKLEEISDSGKDVIIEWYYNEEDEDLEASGREYEDLLNLKFVFYPFT